MSSSSASAAAPSRWWPGVGLGVLFVALGVLMYRLTPGVLHTFPGDRGDPVFNTWNLEWARHALATDPWHYFDAPIFWPATRTVTYSEMLLPLVPVYAVARLATDPTGAMNVTVVACLVLTEAGTYLLARRYVSRRAPAVLAAVTVAFGSYSLAHVAEIQLLTIGFTSLALLATFRLLERPSASRAAVLAGLLWCTTTASLYYGAITAMVLVVVVAGHLLWAAARRRPLPSGTGTSLVVAGLLAAVLLAPFALPYQEVRTREDLTRPVDTRLEGNLVDWVRPAPGNRLYAGVERRTFATVRQEHALYPGTVGALLALAGMGVVVVAAWRRRGDDDPDHPRYHPGHLRELALLGGAAVVSAVLALGTSAAGIDLPLGWLRDHLPAFGSLRASARLVMPALVVLGVLTAVGADAVLHLLRRKPRLAVAASVAAVALALAELGVTIPRVRIDQSPPAMAVYHELASRPAGPVVELPMASVDEGAQWPFVEAPRMLRATTDWHPRVNGYSGYAPHWYRPASRWFNRFPRPLSLAAIRAWEVRYVVLHEGPEGTVFTQYSPDEIQEILLHLPPGATVGRYGTAWLVDLGAP